ncbi:hypothetical protein VTH82DRAFT_3559 [Thermothelomyces myriococcoides]
MSSSQVADASAKSVMARLSVMARFEANLSNNANRTDIADGYRPDHKAPSNSSSTETPGTDETFTLPHCPAPSQPTVGWFSSESTPTHPPLTESNMKLHQHELAQFWRDDIAAWADNAGFCIRRWGDNGDNANKNKNALSTSLGRSLVTASIADGERSVPGSGVSQASDWVMVMPPSMFDEDVAGAGMWSDDMPMPPVMGSRRGSVASSTISLSY